MKNAVEPRNELWAIDAAKQGHSAGLGFLYETHKSYVFRICLRMTRQPELAEDLTQDVFLHVGRKIQLFRGAAAFRSWLHRITINMVVMYFRRHKRVDVSLDDENAPSLALQVPDHSSGRDLEARIWLGEALSFLPPQSRRVLLLHDIEGYDHKNISHLLGITPGASRSQLYHARLKLRVGLGSAAAAKHMIRSRCSSAANAAWRVCMPPAK